MFRGQSVIVDVPYTPLPTVAKFHAAPEHSLDKGIVFHKGLMASKGEGKSIGAVMEGIKLSTYPGNVGWVFRKEFESQKKSTIKFFEEWIPPELLINHNKADHVMHIQTEGKPSEIWFLHGTFPKGLESAEVGWVLFDEADELEYDLVKTALSRVRMTGVPLYALYAFNPPSKSHWLYRHFVKRPLEIPRLQKERQLFKIIRGENKANLPKGYYDQLEEQYTGDERKRFVEGDWGSISSDWAVWQEWRSSLHLSEESLEPVPGVPILRLWDFGMRAGCVCMQMIDKQVRVLYPEVFKFNMGADQFIPYALEKLHKYSSYEHIDLTDPPVVNKRGHLDSTQTTYSVAKKYGVELQGGLVEWTERQRAVNYFLTQLTGGKPCFTVDSRNENIISGFEGEYRYKENAFNREASDVVKNEYSELQDCIQHGCGYYYNQLHMGIDDGIEIPDNMYDFG